MPVNANRIRIRIQALMNAQAMPGNVSINSIQEDVRAANGSTKPVQKQRSAMPVNAGRRRDRHLMNVLMANQNASMSITSANAIKANGLRRNVLLRNRARKQPVSHLTLSLKKFLKRERWRMSARNAVLRILPITVKTTRLFIVRQRGESVRTIDVSFIKNTASSICVVM